MGDEKVKCKQMIRTGKRWFKRDVQCKHGAKKDGYCGHHHPDAVAAKDARLKARRDETTARWEAKWSAEDQRAKAAAEAPALRDQLASLTIQRDAAEALARERLDPAHARAMADAVADRLFVEGERDAALHDLAIARDHLEAANNAHTEAEADLVKMTADRDAAQQMVAEMQPVVAAARAWYARYWSPTGDDDVGSTVRLALSDAVRASIRLDAAPIAGRWCLASERDDAEARFQKAWGVACESNTARDEWKTRAEKALAILRDLVTMTQGYKDRDMASPHHAVSDHEALWLDTDALADRARKLVGGGE
jgi:chromosome segregation ATPase